MSEENIIEIDMNKATPKQEPAPREEIGDRVFVLALLPTSMLVVGELDRAKDILFASLGFMVEPLVDQNTGRVSQYRHIYAPLYSPIYSDLRDIHQASKKFLDFKEVSPLSPIADGYYKARAARITGEKTGSSIIQG